MVSVWRADIKDTLPIDTTNVFYNSDEKVILGAWERRNARTEVANKGIRWRD
jgi:hypothetical protein